MRGNGATTEAAKVLGSSIGSGSSPIRCGAEAEDRSSVRTREMGGTLVKRSWGVGERKDPTSLSSTPNLRDLLPGSDGVERKTSFIYNGHGIVLGQFRTSWEAQSSRDHPAGWRGYIKVERNH